MMIFKIIDKRTGKEPTQRVINNIARKGELIERDIAGFFVGEDGGLILADECGNYTYINSMRFAAKISDEAIRQFCKEKHYKIVSERYYNLIHEKLTYNEKGKKGNVYNEGYNKGYEKAKAEYNQRLISETPIRTCVNCFHNYGVRHNVEFNPEDIVCEYWESDGLTKDDFCSRWKDKESEDANVT